MAIPPNVVGLSFLVSSM